jgi:hypothetical protein
VDAVSREEIDTHWPRTRTAAQSGRLELLEVPRGMSAGEQRTLDVRVYNTGRGVWPWGWKSVPQVWVGSRWYDADGNEIRDSQFRSALPATLPPGASCIVPVHVLAPDVPGAYRIEIDLVHEHVRWFGVGVECTTVVEPRRRIAVVGDDEQLRSVAAILETMPELELVALRRSPSESAAGFPEAPDARQFLFDDAPHSRLAFVAIFAWRSARLLAAAAAVRRGRSVQLPRRGGEFLHAVASSELLVVAGLDAADQRRERRRLEVMTRAARILGVAVVHGSDSRDLLPVIRDE